MRRYTRGFATQPGAAIFKLPSFASIIPLSPVQWVTAALNTLLGRQQAAQQLLATHAGRTFHINARPLPNLALTIGHDGTLSPADAMIVPDVELTIDVGLLLRSGWMPGQDVPDLPGLVHVSGDAAMAQTLSVLAKHWRPDLEDILSDWVGDIAAVQMTQGVRALFKGVLTATHKVTENMAEFLAYESRDLTPVSVMQSLSQNVQVQQSKLATMTQSANALTNRLQALERKHGIAPLLNDSRGVQS